MEAAKRVVQDGPPNPLQAEIDRLKEKCNRLKLKIVNLEFDKKNPSQTEKKGKYPSLFIIYYR